MAKRFKRDIFTGELVEETFDPSSTGRTVIFRGELPFGPNTVTKRSRQAAIRDDKVHVSRSLGVPTKQVDRFNRELENFGVTDARYSHKSGFLESRSDNSRNAAWAIRGHYNPEGGNNADKWANAIGF